MVVYNNAECLDFSLDVIGEKYVILLSPDGLQAKTLVGIDYGDAKVRKVRYFADGVNPCDPKDFIVIVTKSDDATKSGSDTAVVRCALDFTYFTQGNAAWTDSAYDFYKALDDEGNIVQPEYQYKIREKGCALTCMAMVLKSAGVDYTPLTMNNAMNRDGRWGKNRKGNWNGAVVWKTVTKYGESKIKEEPISLGSHRNWDNRIPLNIELLDSHLERCSYVIVLVGNSKISDPTEVTNHWVLVTEKKNEKYYILDPGYSYRKTLDAYNNTIYRAIIYERRCNEE